MTCDLNLTMWHVSNYVVKPGHFKASGVLLHNNSLYCLSSIKKIMMHGMKKGLVFFIAD